MRMTRSPYKTRNKATTSKGGTMWGLVRILLTLYLVMMIQMEQMVMVDCTVLIGVSQRKK